MNVEKLLDALENKNNEKIFQYNSKKIKEMNLRVLKELNLSPEETEELFHKLQDYVYVDELSDFRYGTYIRWMCLTDPENLVLSQGGFFCETKITDQGVFIVCKNVRHRYYQIKMDECLIFRKLLDQEKVLLDALDTLS